jgi:carbamate kinase
MRMVVARGGNALLRCGEPPTAENQHHNIKVAVEAILAEKARSRVIRG